MAVAPAESSSTVVPIDNLPNDVLTEAMLRVLSLGDLVRAAAVSKRWRRVVATQEFLAAYRKRHRSTPFLGLYIPRRFGGLPSFEKAGSIQSAEPDLQRAAARAFSLGGLESHPEWRLLDCYNGRLLLARGNESLQVYSPLSCECISVCLPRDNILPHCFSACLLQGHGGDEVSSSFRVVSVQHECRPRRVRAVEYDSRWKSWRGHPWETLKTNIRGTEQVEVMHAGDLVLCKYIGASLLLLDTRKMEFSVLPLPADNNPRNYAVGEMEDGVCCLASVDSVGIWNKIHMRLWKLEKLEWKLEKKMLVEQVLSVQVLREQGLGEHAGLRRMFYKVCAVTNGIALLCLSLRGHQLDFVVDLKTFSVKDKFEFKDLAFPMQIPWPPTFSVVTDFTVSDEQSTSSTGAHKNSSVTADNANVVNEAQNHVYEMMNPGSNGGKNPETSDGNNGNRPKLRNGTAPQNCMPSNAREDLVIQDPAASVPTPTASEECFEKENDVLNDYDPEESQHNWGPIQVCIKRQSCFEDWDDNEEESPGNCYSDSVSLEESPSGSGPASMPSPVTVKVGIEILAPIQRCCRSNNAESHCHG
ncbi:unnamed protein product [Urochloa humidicola]